MKFINSGRKFINVDNFRDLKAGDWLVFLDSSNTMKSDNSGYNQKGIMIDDQKLLFYRRRFLKTEVVELQVSKLKTKKATVLRIEDKELSNKVTQFFRRCRHNYRLFRAGEIAFLSERNLFFENPDVMPEFEDLYNLSSETYEKRWNHFLSQLEVGDMIFSFDQESKLSRLIGWIDKGSWSHTALYCGGGKTLEAILFAGVTLCDIQDYKPRHVRTGIFRPFLRKGVNKQKIVSEALRLVGTNYAYKKAIISGFYNYFDLASSEQGGKRTTPNSLIYYVHCYLVDYL